MNQNAPLESNVFDPQPPDEETELGALAHAIQMSEGYSIILARCNLLDQRRRLMVTLRGQLPQLHIQVIEFREPILHLLNELRIRMEDPPPDAVFVSGLEYSLPVADKAYATPLIGYMNLLRDRFPRYVPCPLVLWVSDYVIAALSHGAPDFISVRSGLFHFNPSPERVGFEPLFTADELAVVNLPDAEKQERIVTLQGLLADYRSEIADPRNLSTQADLLVRLAHMYLILGQWNEAIGVYRECFDIYEKLDNEVRKGIILNNLGNVYQRQGLWQDAVDCLQESLRIKQKYHDLRGEAQVLTNLGQAFGKQPQYSRQAEQSLTEALAIAQTLQDLVNEGAILNNLGNLSAGQMRLSQAEQYYRQALSLSYQTKDRANEAQILNNLGNIYVAQGRLVEGRKAFEQSLTIKRELGNRVEEGQTLNNLALLTARQGDIGEALLYARQAVEVLQDTDATEELRRAYDIIAECGTHQQV